MLEISLCTALTIINKLTKYANDETIKEINDITKEFLHVCAMRENETEMVSKNKLIDMYRTSAEKYDPDFENKIEFAVNYAFNDLKNLRLGGRKSHRLRSKKQRRSRRRQSRRSRL